MIFTHEHLRGERRLAADVCVIGSGAGGGPVAATLAERGLDVVVLEAGSFWQPRDFTQIEADMFPRLFHDGAGRATRDKSIHVHQGKGVGGSTLHNLNLCKRVPDEIRTAWRLAGVDDSPWDALYDEVERLLEVKAVLPEQINAHNEVLRRGCEALGYRHAVLRHNRSGCVGSGFCELGCPYDAKNNALKMLATRAVHAGARILADTWATRVVGSGTKVRSVEAVVRDPATGAELGTVEIIPRAVCSSASATGTPALLQRSAVPDPHRLVGSRIFLHPGAAVAAVFDEELHAWSGIPQSIECTEFLDFAPTSGRRAWILPSFAHPAGVSAILPGIAEDHAQAMEDYPRLAALSAMVHDERPGRVGPSGAFGVDIDYGLGPEDAAQLVLGLRECARLLHAAGARRVLLPLRELVEIDRSEVDSFFDQFQVVAQDLELTAVHPMGSVWMGSDPTRSCVDSTGRYHRLDNLWVADTSLFPSSIGVPPQLTTYMLGFLVGRSMLDALG